MSKKWIPLKKFHVDLETNKKHFLLRSLFEEVDKLENFSASCILHKHRNNVNNMRNLKLQYTFNNIKIININFKLDYFYLAGLNLQNFCICVFTIQFIHPKKITTN